MSQVQSTRVRTAPARTGQGQPTHTLTATAADVAVATAVTARGTGVPAAAPVGVITTVSLPTPSNAEPDGFHVRRSQVLQSIAGTGAAVAVLVWGLPHLTGTSWAQIGHVLAGVGPLSAVALMALMVLGLWCYTFTLAGSLPGLSHLKALTLNVCGSAVGNLLPAGGAAGVAATYLLGRSWGFTQRELSTSVVVTGIWNVLARLTLPVVAITVLLTSGSGGLPAAVAGGAVIGGVVGTTLLAVFITLLLSEAAAVRFGRALHRLTQPVLSRVRPNRQIRIDELILDIRARTAAVVRRGWRSLTFGLVGMFAVNFGLFWCCLHVVGAQASLPHIFTAYAIGRLLTTIGITPGGLGITETGTAAVLIGWSMAPTTATAGVVLFSIYTHLMEIPLGALGWIGWIATTPNTRRPPASQPAPPSEHHHVTAATTRQLASTPGPNSKEEPT